MKIKKEDLSTAMADIPDEELASKEEARERTLGGKLDKWEICKLEDGKVVGVGHDRWNQVKDRNQDQDRNLGCAFVRQAFRIRKVSGTAAYIAGLPADELASRFDAEAAETPRWRSSGARKE